MSKVSEFETANAVKQTIIETAQLCKAAAAEHPIDGHARIDFLFLSKQHGLAGWTKEEAL